MLTPKVYLIEKRSIELDMESSFVQIAYMNTEEGTIGELYDGVFGERERNVDVLQ